MSMQTNKLKIITKDTEMKFGSFVLEDSTSVNDDVVRKAIVYVIVDVQNADVIHAASAHDLRRECDIPSGFAYSAS
jgi:hypothetical protein